MQWLLLTSYVYVCLVCNLNTLCIDGGQVGLGIWWLKSPQIVTFKHYIFLSHLLVCVPKLHELCFIIKEGKFLLSIHAYTKPHSCAVCTHWCACDLEREYFITTLLEAEFLTDFPASWKGSCIFLRLCKYSFKCSRNGAQDGVVSTLTLWAGQFGDWIPVQARFSVPSAPYSGYCVLPSKCQG